MKTISEAAARANVVSLIKCLILAGGYGTRLGELTKDTPKPLIEINGKPILEHIIGYLEKYGITDIIVNTHYFSDKIQKHFGTRLIYSYEPELLGTAGTVKSVGRWLDDDMLVLNGDTIQTLNLDQFIWHYQRQRLPISFAFYRGKCTGVMMFHKNILPILPRTGMIDDFVNEHTELLEKYESDEHAYIDIGTPEGLQKAREYV